MRPGNDEYAPYYETYVRLVPEGNVVTALRDEIELTAGTLEGIDAEAETKLHPPYTWSIRQVVGHLIDGERVFSDRALRISRGDTTPLPSFDESSYVENSTYTVTDLSRLLNEFSRLRAANILMFENMSESQWLRRGIANNSPVSVRALAYMMVGHERHHMAIIRERLQRV